LLRGGGEEDIVTIRRSKRMEIKEIRQWLEENGYKFAAHEEARVTGDFYVVPKAKLDALEIKELNKRRQL